MSGHDDCCIEVVEFTETIEIVEYDDHCELVIEESDQPEVTEIIEIRELVIEQTDGPDLELVQECEPGQRGLKGETGIPEIEMIYAKCVDFTNDGTNDVIYRGEAVPGTQLGEPAWRIRRITVEPDCDIKEEWANGNADFNKSFEDRLTFTYS